MLLIVKFIAKILSVLNSEVSPKQIAAGFAYGVLIGFIPVKGLLPLFLILFGFIININLPMMFVGAGIFKLISYVSDGAANQLGFYLLTQVEGLKAFWTTLYNSPIIPFTRYNNTIVMGSLVIGLLALIPVYFLMVVFVQKYRTGFRDRIMKFKIVQIIKASSLYKYYLTYKGITGG